MVNEIGFCTNCGVLAEDLPEYSSCPECGHAQPESLGDPVDDGDDPITTEIPFS